MVPMQAVTGTVSVAGDANGADFASDASDNHLGEGGVGGIGWHQRDGAGGGTGFAEGGNSTYVRQRRGHGRQRQRRTGRVRRRSQYVIGNYVSASNGYARMTVPLTDGVFGFVADVGAAGGSSFRC